jgi:hypothetical protein
MKCETCQEEATIHVEVLNMHFCKSCLDKLDKRIHEINAHPFCNECLGRHEPSGARTDCIEHWRKRAIRAEAMIRDGVV